MNRAGYPALTKKVKITNITGDGQPLIA